MQKSFERIFFCSKLQILQHTLKRTSDPNGITVKGKWGNSFVTVPATGEHKLSRWLFTFYFDNHDCETYTTFEGTLSGLLLHEWAKSADIPYPLCEPVDANKRLTDDHKDKEGSGHSCGDVEHGSDVVLQLIHIVHVRHKYGWDQEPNGNTQLVVRGKKLQSVQTITKVRNGWKSLA